MLALSFISTPFTNLHPLPHTKFHSTHSRKLNLYTPTNAIKTPRGFGPVSKKPKTKNTSKRKQEKDNNEEEDEEEEEEEDEEVEKDAVIPEIVTNRMMKRMGLSVGIPLSVGLSFFPFFYYLKVIAKIDIPNWVPFIVSFIFFGTALAGVSYGIVSASWDPMREGSFLGWNEARKNWPVFWQSLRGGDKK